MSPLPPRVRLELGAQECRNLSADARRALDALCKARGLGWRKLYGAPPQSGVTGHLSTPLDPADGCAVVLAMRPLGLSPRTVHAPRSQHLACVQLGGAWLVMGAGADMPDRDAALTIGTPVARIVERQGVHAVEPWEAHVTGHTDAELLAAPVRDAGRRAA